MNEEIDTKNCRLAGDMLHIQFTNGESYVFSLGEIVEQCAGGLTPRALDSATSPRIGVTTNESGELVFLFGEESPSQ